MVAIETQPASSRGLSPGQEAFLSWVHIIRYISGFIVMRRIVTTHCVVCTHYMHAPAVNYMR